MARAARGRRLHAGFLALLICGPAELSYAQGSAGAERYEVTITPPKRPGPASDEVQAAPKATEKPTKDASPGSQAAAAVDTESDDHILGAEAPANAPSGRAESAAPPATPTSIDPSLPRRTLQVGAFRQRSLAVAMQGKLASSFPNVAVVEVQSGGTPLYRVNVGRLPKGTALRDLKNRLADAGYPSFDVPAPPTAATN